MDKSTAFTVCDSFVLRTPFLPYNIINQLLAGKNNKNFLEQLIDLCNTNPVIMEALLCKAPDLYTHLQKWSKGEITGQTGNEHSFAEIARFIVDMSTQNVSGFSTGKWGEYNKIELSDAANCSRQIHLDLNFLYILAQELGKHPAIKNNIKYFPNAAIFTIADQLRYVRHFYENGKLKRELAEVDYSEYLQSLLSESAKGARFPDLVNILAKDEISFEEARDFIAEVIEIQVLVNELVPTAANPDPLKHILNVLQPIKGINDIKESLQRVSSAIHTVNNSKIGSLNSHYPEISEDIRDLGVEYELKHLFQINMVIPAEHCMLDRQVVNDVLKGIEILNRLSIKQTTTDLNEFKENFYEKYGEKEVPLIRAFDPDSPVGYKQTGNRNDPSAVEEALLIPRFSGTYDIRWDSYNAFLFNKYVKSITNREHEISLTDDDLKLFAAKWDDLPDTLATAVRFAADEKKGNRLKGKENIVIGPVEGPVPVSSAVNSCYADLQGRNFIKEIANREENLNPGVIMAEITDLPQPGSESFPSPRGVYKYEIPYLLKSSAPGKFLIKLDDLMISVSEDQVKLRSRRLNKEVIPRLPADWQFKPGDLLPIYRFFSDMQSYNKNNRLEFSWGALNQGYDFLPRVRYKNIILSLARWDINKKDIKHFFKIQDDSKLLRAIAEWREKFRIPGEVFLQAGDKTHYLNLENLFFVKTFVSLINGRQSFSLLEFIFDRRNTPLESKEGVFLNEFILTFYKKS